MTFGFVDHPMMYAAGIEQMQTVCMPRRQSDVSGVGEQLDLRDARIADEHLQTAEFLLGPGNGGAHLGGVARVGPDGKIEAAGVDFFGLTAHGVGGIGMGIVRKGDVIACPGKGQHRRRTDAAAAAGVSDAFDCFTGFHTGA